MNIKTLGRDDFLLKQDVKCYRFPHLAMEIESQLSNEKYADGSLILLTSPFIRLVAMVFKPGGSRFLLKNFEVYYTYEKQNKSWWRILKDWLFKQKEFTNEKIIKDIEETIKYSLLSPPG